MNNFSSVTVGWVALSTGCVGLLAFATIILFFTVGQPFGTLNDICIGLTAILSVLLVWMLYPEYRAQLLLLSQALLMIAMFGAILVVIGSVLAISGARGWFLSGLYMAAGNAMFGGFARDTRLFWNITTSIYSKSGETHDNKQFLNRNNWLDRNRHRRLSHPCGDIPHLNVYRKSVLWQGK
jgi:hypothetical protein